MKKISVLIPAYNEEESLPLLFEKLQEIMNSMSQYIWEILLVNDGSTDNTLATMELMRQKDERINYVDLSRNYGKEIAMLAGFDFMTGDCLVIMDADLQHPPDLIPEMLKYWEEGYDDIYAKRKNRPGESFLRKRFSESFYRLSQNLSNISIPQNIGDFRLLDRTCVNALRKMRESQRYTKGLYFWIGFKKKEIEFEQRERVQGTSKWSFMNLLNLAIEGITSFSTTPLRISSIVGFFISIGAFIYMFYILIKALVIGDPVQGFPTLVVIILFLGGIQLISLGVIGEYLGRIFYETKNRPVYFARTYNGEKLPQ